jgi:trimeric autotransporter adhesin
MRKAGIGRWMKRGALAFLVTALFVPAWAQKVKDPKSGLDLLTFSRPELRVSQTLTEAEALAGRLEGLSDMDRFRSEYGTGWHFLMDERTGRVNLLDGGAIPFVPGPANDLRWGDSAEASCRSASCIPVPKMEGLAREFLAKHQSLFKVPQDELALDPDGSGPVGDSIYSLRFQWVVRGVPVEGASIDFVVNSGNLIQVGFQNIGDMRLDPIPNISRETAWQILAGYLGRPDRSDAAVDPGTLVILPVTPKGMDPDTFSAPFGKMIDYALVYRLAFRRSGLLGTWEALVDAHTGEVLRFMDSNKYGHIQGGVYKTDAPQTEVTAAFPFANYSGSGYADTAGNFAGTAGTSTMAGRNGTTGVVGGVTISDQCGAISLAADGSGLIDFGGGGGTDCTTPGFGGSGNTHAARTQYWNVTQIKMKAYTYLPRNTWLQSRLTDRVNLNQTCNAYWDGMRINFFKSGGGCGNTGEIPGVSLHEWGHGLDDNDGSGGGNSPVETRADWTAILQTHQSCAGGGFIQGGNCWGYGDACTDCSGVRESDYAKHAHPTPWTPQNNGKSDPGYSCSSGGYTGPCGWEDHCESGIATQALWDLVNRDLLGAPTNMDVVSAWQLADRLFYSTVAQARAMYSCTGGTTKTSNGCGSGSIYTTYRAVDDDGDGTSNGTPHAAAIFAALSRHGIACGGATDAANRNQTSCPSLAQPALSGTAGNGRNSLTWAAVTGATRYFVFRNETGCGAGYTRIATVTAGTAYADTAVANGVTYFYRVQASTVKDQCVSAMSNCLTLTPQTCTTPGVPAIGTVTVPGNNQLTVSWSAGSPAGATYNVYRALGACPGGTFAPVQSGLTTSPWTDTAVSGGTSYSYQVTAVHSSGGCESAPSACASAAATGPCTLPPTFAGLATVANPAGATCTLNLAWAAGTSNCAGILAYNVYRSTAYPFTPAAGNRIAASVAGTAYSDASGLVMGTTYYYIARAVDLGNAAEDANTVTRSAVPTGATATLTETFEGAGGFDLAGWTHAPLHGTVDWTWSTAQHKDGAHSWFAQDIATVSDMVLASPPFLVVADTTLSFYHTYRFMGAPATCFDGGTLEYSTDGVSWTVVPDADFAAGGFNGTVYTLFKNPLAGKRAWCGGTLGAMTRVLVNLGADPGVVYKTIQIRWHEGNDNFGSLVGWYVDSVAIENAGAGSCSTGP